ncbi:DUF4829 domain-containing protein [Clostridium frigidicarnis]|uniref:DUF4829 domain-containing protein n=1 Tax=Clostridium frigidicarnis TaxID=84698 RepID=A0A1I1AT95_9CLOT|nr:DUF4829 domain-containing protein [Clostridium frigidicarnis]SFB41097.1 protein of unknown function [Clostridium frigidicarnis]
MYLKNNNKFKILICIFFLACLGIISLYVFNSKKNIDPVNLDALDPTEVIEKYFEYYNIKDKRKVLLTMTPKDSDLDVIFGFKYLEYIKIINIEDANSTQRDSYISNGISKENVNVFEVTFESKYLINNPPWESGTRCIYFVLIRDNDSSPWLIDAIGE